MNGYLLDTNLISELVRPVPQPNVVQWVESVDSSYLYLSVLTFGEISKGVSSLSDGKMRRQLIRWLDSDLLAEFEGRILPVDVAVALKWGAISADARKQGRPIAVVDGLIAATAMVHELAIVTRNSRDFDYLELNTINPWDL